MDYSVVPTKYQLRVFSAVASNFSVFWLAATLVTSNRVTLLANLFFGMVALLAALILERSLESYDS